MERSADQAPTIPRLPDPGKQLAALQRIAERSRRVAELWLSGKGNGGSMPAGSTAGMTLAQDFLEAATRLMLRPDQLLQAHARLWQDYLALAHHTTQRLMGQASEPVIEPARDDRRFKGEGWQDPVFDLIKQGYLLSARCLQTTLKGVEGLDEGKKKRLCCRVGGSAVSG